MVDEPIDEPVVSDPEDDFVSRDEYKKVVNESIKRKNQLKELRSELETLKEKAGKVEEVTGNVENYKKIIEKKDQEITELRHLQQVRNSLSKLNPRNERVAEIAFKDITEADAFDDIDVFLVNWKKDNKDFFREESVITSPTSKSKVADPPVVTSLNEELSSMTKEDKMRMPADKRTKIIDELRKQAYNR